MRKLQFLLIFLAISIGLISLTDDINDINSYEVQSSANSIKKDIEFSKAGSSDACAGCHTGGTTILGGGGYVIIVYANGKTNTDLNLNQLSSKMVIYSNGENAGGIISDLENQEVQVNSTIRLEDAIDKNLFTVNHGAKSEEILSHLNLVELTINEPKTVTINTTKDFTVLFNNTNMQLNLNSNLNENLQVSLFDLMGKSYLINSTCSVIKGTNQLNFESNNPISRGIYIVKMQDSFGKITTKKIFVD